MSSVTSSITSLRSWHLLLVVLIIGAFPAGYGQTTSATAELSEEVEIESNAVREEVQRYFGYEDLLYRYLTLPYDLSQNVNQKGRHVDFGFALFALLPLLLLLAVYKRKVWFYSIACSMLIYLGLCFRYSHIVTSERRLAISPDTNLWTQFSSSSELTLSEQMLYSLYSLGLLITAPLRMILDQITDQTDHLTYPVIIILLIAMIWGVVKNQSLSNKLKITLIIFTIYSFFWYITSGGIIWYGMLMIPLAYIILIYGLNRNQGIAQLNIKPYFNYFSIGVMSIWIMSAYIMRISDIKLSETDPTFKGTGIMDPAFFLYASGKIGKAETLQFMNPNLPTAVNAMNKDRRRVFQVGTHLVFDIKENDKRVFEDNLLAVFGQLVEDNNSKSKIHQALKGYGFGYLLIDLNLPGMDRTPERSLVNKFKILLASVKDNPGIKLVATDRIVTKTVNGRKIDDYGVFGDAIPQHGNYALYEIL